MRGGGFSWRLAWNEDEGSGVRVREDSTAGPKDLFSQIVYGIRDFSEYERVLFFALGRTRPRRNFVYISDQKEAAIEVYKMR
jgi:hypothetical protein